MPNYYTKFQKNPCVGRNERCPFEKQIQCRPTSLEWVSKICTIGLLQRTCKYLCQCKVTLSIRSHYSDFDTTSSFSYIISGIRNLNDGPCFVKSVNNRVRGLSSP